MSSRLATAAPRRHIRELPAEEVRAWLSRLDRHWGLKFDPEEWPQVDDALLVRALRMGREDVPRELLPDLLTEIGVREVIELSVAVLGGYEVKLADADFAHDPLGGVWTDAEMSWLIYDLPWGRAALVGEALVARFRERVSGRAAALPGDHRKIMRERQPPGDGVDQSVPVRVNSAPSGREKLLEEARKVMEAMSTEDLGAVVRELRARSPGRK